MQRAVHRSSQLSHESWVWGTVCRQGVLVAYSNRPLTDGRGWLVMKLGGGGTIRETLPGGRCSDGGQAAGFNHLLTLWAFLSPVGALPHVPPSPRPAQRREGGNGETLVKQRHATGERIPCRTLVTGIAVLTLSHRLLSKGVIGVCCFAKCG